MVSIIRQSNPSARASSSWRSCSTTPSENATRKPRPWRPWNAAAKSSLRARTAEQNRAEIERQIAEGLASHQAEIAALQRSISDAALLHSRELNSAALSLAAWMPFLYPIFLGERACALSCDLPSFDGPVPLRCLTGGLSAESAPSCAFPMPFFPGRLGAPPRARSAHPFPEKLRS